MMLARSDGLHRQHLERVRHGRLPGAGRLQHLQVRRAGAHGVPVEANSTAPAFARSACARAASRPTSRGPGVGARQPCEEEARFSALADKLLQTSPDECAADIIAGIERGQEAHHHAATARRTLFWLSRLLPNSYPAVLKRIAGQSGACPTPRCQNSRDHDYVAGIAMTVFGRHPERSLHDLAGEALTRALADAGCTDRDSASPTTRA